MFCFVLFFKEMEVTANKPLPQSGWYDLKNVSWLNDLFYLLQLGLFKYLNTNKMKSFSGIFWWREGPSNELKYLWQLFHQLWASFPTQQQTRQSSGERRKNKVPVPVSFLLYSTEDPWELSSLASQHQGAREGNSRLRRPLFTVESMNGLASMYYVYLLFHLRTCFAYI